MHADPAPSYARFSHPPPPAKPKNRIEEAPSDVYMSWPIFRPLTRLQLDPTFSPPSLRAKVRDMRRPPLTRHRWLLSK